jgi:hypothetical protein
MCVCVCVCVRGGGANSPAKCSQPNDSTMSDNEKYKSQISRFTGYKGSTLLE